jgi:hypothetical protein
MKGRKTGGRDFRPGESGNPRGRPKMPKEVKAIRKLSQESVELLLNKYLSMKFKDLKELIETQESDSADMLVATVIYKGITKGDHYRLDFLLNRLIGKVTDKVEVKVPRATVIHRPNGEQVELGARFDEDEQKNKRGKQ